MIVRQAVERDSDAVFLLARAFATTFTVELTAFERAFTELQTNPDAFLAVAEVNEEVVGYLLGFDHLTFFANGRVGWVEAVMVCKTYRRLGIGRRLIKAFEEWAKERDMKLAALATRRAPDFYAALGYEESASYFRKMI